MILDNMYLYLFHILSLFFVVALLVKGASITKSLFKKQTTLPYRSRGTLLTKAELNFYRQISPIFSDLGIYASMKVRLWDVIDVETNTDKSFTYQNKISSKHIDFVLYDKDTNILVCIELDDSSHNSSDAKERDAFKNNALESAGVPLIRIKAKRSYDTLEIKEKIKEKI